MQTGCCLSTKGHAGGGLVQGGPHSRGILPSGSSARHSGRRALAYSCWPWCMLCKGVDTPSLYLLHRCLSQQTAGQGEARLSAWVYSRPLWQAVSK